MPIPHPVPCAHLNEVDEVCVIGRTFPEDCGACPAYVDGIDPHERTRCEVWSRVMGYHRPVSAYNAGKKAEHKARKLFIEKPDDLNGYGI